MTDAPETALAVPTGPRDEAVVSYGLYAKRLSDLALELLAHHLDAPPGDRVRRALALGDVLDKLVSQAVVAEREDGASWRAIGEAVGMTRQSAAGRWGPAMDAWKARGRTLNGSSGETRAAAATLDRAYARLDPEHSPTAFSDTLHVVRFPEREADRARRERADAAKDQLRALRESTDRQTRDFHSCDIPATKAAALRRRAVVQDQAARIFDELAMHCPEEAAAYRSGADQCRQEAHADREFADLLAPQDAPAAAP